MSVSNILRGHDLFQSLPVEDVDTITTFSAVKNFDANSTLFKLNAKASHVFMLMEGEVHLILPAQSSDHGIVVSTVERGELFGLSPLLGSQRYTLEAHCHRSTSALAIEAAPFVELLQRHPVVGFHTMRQAAQIYFQRNIDMLKNLQSVVSHIPLNH